MKWSDLPLKPTARALRQFAAAWLIFFLAVGVFRYVARGQHQIGIAVGLMAVVVGVTGLIRPAAVRWLFVGATVLAFPIGWVVSQVMLGDRKSTRLNSSHLGISYAVFCLKKK